MRAVDGVFVIYHGRFTEVTPPDQLLMNPKHPFTVALLSVIPTDDPTADAGQRLFRVGNISGPMNPPTGCRFQTLCPSVEKKNMMTDSPATGVGDDGSRWGFAVEYRGADLPAEAD